MFVCARTRACVAWSCVPARACAPVCTLTHRGDYTHTQVSIGSDVCPEGDTEITEKRLKTLDMINKMKSQGRLKAAEPQPFCNADKTVRSAFMCAVCVCGRVRVSACSHSHACIYTCHIQMHACMHACMHTHIHTYTHTHTHTHKHTCIHTYRCMHVHTCAGVRRQAHVTGHAGGHEKASRHHSYKSN